MDKETIKQTLRFYKGEETNPYEDLNGVDLNNMDKRSALWYYEKGWYEMKKIGVFCAFNDWVNIYKSKGLEHFCEEDGVDITYKASLFEKYCAPMNYSEISIKWFKEMYLMYYKYELK